MTIAIRRRGSAVASLAGALTLTAATTLALGASAGPAAASPISSCTATTGAIVAVDFGHWDGPIVRGCDANPTTGWNLLHNGGFTTTGTAHDGPGFICRIGNPAFSSGTQYPTPAEDACVVTSPATAYWSFWVAPQGATTWSYATTGATGDVVKNGEVEAWTFGSTDIDSTTGKPTFTPASVRAS